MLAPVAARSKASLCGRSLAGITGSIPPGDMGVCLLRVLCVVRWVRFPPGTWVSVTSVVCCQVGSIPPGDMGVCLLRVLCVVR